MWWGCELAENRLHLDLARSDRPVIVERMLQVPYDLRPEVGGVGQPLGHQTCGRSAAECPHRIGNAEAENQGCMERATPDRRCGWSGRRRSVSGGHRLVDRESPTLTSHPNAQDHPQITGRGHHDRESDRGAWPDR